MKSNTQLIIELFQKFNLTYSVCCGKVRQIGMWENVNAEVDADWGKACLILSLALNEQTVKLIDLLAIK